ncbi:hypothetical protein SPI_06864 [Niveomyces insectorum RCEF 264]|uniref:BZIP domain-containing protein n=1 Tax=Niveomyces insectorum RCEF 264 TaxID=1081102 RepID=A0A167QUK8_9HYPO|nr:hypothetical protein SPI_06864 [Niveomyces insectorum RCEF 264]
MGRQNPAKRRISNLTASQIEKKRAIDRANQQHCQRKKRARLQWLEEEVVRLSKALTAAEAKLRQYAEKEGCGCFARPPGPAVPVNVDADKSLVPAAAAASVHDVVDPSRSSATWTVNLRELLDPGQCDELGRIVFEYPLPLPDPAPPSPPPPPSHAQGGGSGDNRDDGGVVVAVADWHVVPLHLAPTTDLDKLIIETTQSGRRLHQQSGAAELSHAQFPSISSLLNPNLGDDGSRPLTSALALHVVQRSQTKSATTRIALMYILSHLLRWLVCRNKQSYDKLPGFLRPTRLQCTVPHPAWIDVVTWPEARDTIIREKLWTTFGFDEFRRVTGNCMSVNWPYTDSGAFVDLGDGQNSVLSPLFENHIRNANNWTLSSSTALVFPFMEAFCVAPDEPEESL